MKKRLTAIILVTIMVFHVGCSTSGTVQEASSGQATSSEAQTTDSADTTKPAPADTSRKEASTGKTDEESAITPDQERAYKLYADKVTELEETYGAMTVDLYGRGMPNKDWRYAHGLMLLKLLDFDKDGVEELITVFSHEGEDPKIRVYTAREKTLFGLFSSTVGNRESPSVHQVTFGTFDRNPAFFLQRDSADYYAFTCDDDHLDVAALVDLEKGIVKDERGKSRKMHDPLPEETYYFTYDTKASLSGLDDLCAATNETRALLGLTDNVSYEMRDASKEYFLFQAALRGNVKVSLQANGESTEYYLTNDIRFAYVEGHRNYALRDINGDGKDEMLMRVDDHYLRVFVAQNAGVSEIMLPFYTGSTTEEICENGTLYMLDDTHPGRETYMITSLNKDNALADVAVLHHEYPDPFYAVPEETFSLTQNGQTLKLTKDEFEQMKKAFKDTTINPDYIPMPNPNIDSPVSAVELAKMTAGEALEVLGDEYFLYFYSGTGYLYPDRGIVFAPNEYGKALAVAPDSTLAGVAVYGRYEVFSYLRGSSTWPEIKSVLDAAGITADAPEKYYDAHDGVDEYVATFTHDGCEISCYWYEEPETNPCYQILVKPRNN